MTAATKSTPPAPTRSVEADLLARLGLPKSASTQDVETAHDAVIGFLETAPSDIRGWARLETDRVDEAYALLSDPTIDRSELVAAADLPVQPAATPAAVAPLPEIAVARPSGNTRTIRRLAMVGAAIAGAAVIVIAVFNMGGGTGVPGVNGSPAPAAAASPGIDTAKVGELMVKIQADPTDTESLQALADIYYGANDYATASGFLEKILTVDDKNVTALLALGAARFNLGQPDEAEARWRQVLAIDDNNLEAHYDLGFMYLSRTPADVEDARTEWTRVVQIAPDSDVAKSIQQHLASLDASPIPVASGAAASPAPAASPAASAAPAASPAAGRSGSPAPAN
jgi:tetratricopeptide (TPR) repeat protein